MIAEKSLPVPPIRRTQGAFPVIGSLLDRAECLVAGKGVEVIAVVWRSRVRLRIRRMLAVESFE